ncbi:MAG: hypothetical protein ABSE69_16845 [Roseiarcus sp.]|jgi:hypothetical protein
MSQDDGRFAHVVQIAYELARTGQFEDFASIEREVIAEGLEEGIHWLERPEIQRELTEICESNRQTPSWRHYTAF